MRVALFGQVAFKYEQDCQGIYKKISTQIIDKCTKDVNDFLT